MKNLKLIALLTVLSVVATGCNNDDGPSSGNLALNLSGLENLGEGFAYEGWVIVNGSPVSTGTFTIDANGVASQTSFVVAQSDLSNASKFVLSIEPVPDNDPAPAAPKVLEGNFANGSAMLSTSMVGDFSNASGAFFLRTPTDESGMNNGNDENGVWFGTPGMPPTGNFVLPELADGWIYEGWVVGDSGPLTTGTFSQFNMADNADPYSATMQPGPPIPGEDFFINAPSGENFPLDIRNRTIVISVEPVPDNSPMPFALKPLVATAGTETAPTTHAFARNLGSLPTGTASY